MKLYSFVFWIACALALSPVTQAKTKAKPTAHSAVRKGVSHAAPVRKASKGKGKARSSSRIARASLKPGKRGRGRHVQQAAAPPVATWRRGQMEPSPDRYREIQQALASKGYLKSEPSGNWDGDSQDALRRFQADQKLEQSGKVTAKSLIALGLGPAKGSDLQSAGSGAPVQDK